MICVVDYGRGNLFSIGQALEYIGVPYEVSEHPEKLKSADRIILPGVGAFGDAVDGLHKRGLTELICDLARDGKPVLGICLGAQLLVDSSEEFGVHRGLGLIPGKIKRLPRASHSGAGTRVPNIGWRKLADRSDSPLFGDLPDDPSFYFVHSYSAVVENPSHVAAKIDFNGHEITAVIQFQNIVGCQFHPEKSGEMGLTLLKNFAEISH